MALIKFCRIHRAGIPNGHSAKVKIAVTVTVTVLAKHPPTFTVSLEQDLQGVSYRRGVISNGAHRFSGVCQIPWYQKYKSRLLKLSFGRNQKQTKYYFLWLKIFIWKHCFQSFFPQAHMSKLLTMKSTLKRQTRVGRRLLLKHATGRDSHWHVHRQNSHEKKHHWQSSEEETATVKW